MRKVICANFGMLIKNLHFVSWTLSEFFYSETTPSDQNAQKVRRSQRMTWQ